MKVSKEKQNPIFRTYIIVYTNNLYHKSKHYIFIWICMHEYRAGVNLHSQSELLLDHEQIIIVYFHWCVPFIIYKISDQSKMT